MALYDAGGEEFVEDAEGEKGGSKIIGFGSTCGAVDDVDMSLEKKIFSVVGMVEEIASDGSRRYYIEYIVVVVSL